MLSQPAMGTTVLLFVVGHILTTVLTTGAIDEVIPRVTFHYASAERIVRKFEIDGVAHYTTLLLSQDGSTLYVGAQEAIFSLNSTDFLSGREAHAQLTWKADDEKKRECALKGKDPQRDCQNYIKILLQLNSTHLYACGTYAFSPTCTYINIHDFSLEKDSSGNPVMEDGKGRCPFDPKYNSTAIMVDGEMYAGTVSHFQGNEPIIYKSHDGRISMKTENSLNWLEDPAFVGSAYIRESLPKGNPVGDDDKIYFFFSETAKEFDFFENIIVPRIARVCKGDLGGERVLQRRWTTFLKAPLLCARAEDGFPFNVLQDMFVLTSEEQHWKNTIFYGVFTSQWNRGSSGSSAVCAFSMQDVENAFSGLYREVNRETQHWYTYTHSVPEPRPGSCITNNVRQMKINSSLQMPDRVLNFVKDHFLMDSEIRSKPLLLQAQMRYQQISVQRVRGLRKTYDVLFLGTDDGRMHKAVSVNEKVHIIEEIKLFQNQQPVQELLLDHNKGLIYASSHSVVVQVPVSNCSMYRSCEECVLSRDPYCAWNRRVCHNVRHHIHDMNTQHWVQDIEGADTEKLCSQINSTVPHGRVNRTEPECQKISLDFDTVTLPCKLLSNLASRLWIHDGKVNNSYFVLQTGDLILVRSPDSLGTYECWSEEKGFRKLMGRYCVESSNYIKTSTQRTDTERTVPKINDFEIFLNTSKSVSSSESHSAKLTGKSYWNEFLIMSTLFGCVLVILALFILYKHRKGMKTFLKPVEHPDKQPKMLRKNGKPAESLPLNGTSAPVPAADHKGYQTLNDNYIINTPVHEALVGNNILSESEKRPLNIKDTIVEVSPVSPRPRVRLGSEIRDSVV
ncbi:semaphorin-4B [Bombina bombina]|uniref:semaphorin-4B n=1 Tax=Bombina bombina TaxID=8345 RepID=UPI00235B143B|nr:semaphorin-4B [Bombina bombina]